MSERGIKERMLEVLENPDLADQVVEKIEDENRNRANLFAYQVGGWDELGKQIGSLIEQAQEVDEAGDLSQFRASSLVEVSALLSQASRAGDFDIVLEDV